MRVCASPYVCVFVCVTMRVCVCVHHHPCVCCVCVHHHPCVCCVCVHRHVQMCVFVCVVRVCTYMCDIVCTCTQGAFGEVRLVQKVDTGYVYALYKVEMLEKDSCFQATHSIRLLMVNSAGVAPVTFN